MSPSVSHIRFTFSDNNCIINGMYLYIIPPNLLFAKGPESIRDLAKRGWGRFSNKCQFNYETADIPEERMI